MVGFIKTALLALLVWGVAALATWATFTPPVPPKLVSLANRTAQTDIASAPAMKSYLDAITGKDLWGKSLQSKQAENASQPAERWDRIAITKEAKDTFVLLKSPTGEIKSFRKGDTLPDGTKLLKLSSTEAVIKPEQGKPQKIRLLD